MHPECDNVTACHDLDIIEETNEALRVYCKVCKHEYTVPKDKNGNPEKRIYAALFKREILQPGENLYYKYHPSKLHVL